jgi:hypothetical protein
MKKLVSAIAPFTPGQLAADALAIIDGGAPPARSTTYNGPRTNTHNPDVRASSDWRSQPENQPSAGFGTFTGTPASPRPQKPNHYIDTNKMEEQASLPPWNVV